MIKKALFPLLLLLTLVSCEKGNQEPDDQLPNFEVFIGDLGNSNLSAVNTSDDQILICSNSWPDVSLIKTTKKGDLLWRKDFDAGDASVGTSLVEAKDGSIFICGITSRNDHYNERDILLIKTDQQGDTLWTKTYGGFDLDYAQSIIETSDGKILISGKSESFGDETYGDIFLIKADYDGDTIWTRTYPDPDQEVPFHLLETSDGNYLVTGTNEDEGNPREAYLLKVASIGEKLWDRKIGPAVWKWGHCTVELSTSDLLVCGKVSVEGYSQILLIKTDEFGNTIWEKNYGEGDYHEQGLCIQVDINGTYTIVGSGYNPLNNSEDVVLLKIDPEGEPIWNRIFGGEGYEWGWNLIKDYNDDNIIVGNRILDEDQDFESFLTIVDSNGYYK